MPRSMPNQLRHEQTCGAGFLSCSIPPFMKLSVVMPVYNEVKTVEEAVRKVESVAMGIDIEIVLIDDGSTDGSREIMERLESESDGRKLVLHEKNKGKGAALRSGFEVADGDLIVIHDADLEYDPNEFIKLLAPIRDGHADVVFGSRFLGGGPHRVVYFWHYVANRLITVFSDMMTGLNLTDIEVCQKMFKKEVLSGLELEENRFGFEVEFTAKVARGGWKVYEVPVSYYGRDYSEGKKITWRDGVWALWCVIKYRFV